MNRSLGKDKIVNSGKVLSSIKYQETLGSVIMFGGRTQFCGYGQEFHLKITFWSNLLYKGTKDTNQMTAVMTTKPKKGHLLLAFQMTPHQNRCIKDCSSRQRYPREGRCAEVGGSRKHIIISVRQSRVHVRVTFMQSRLTRKVTNT